MLPTPSQTVGPYFNLGLPGDRADIGDAFTVTGVVSDGEGVPIPDALIEVWQANAGGRYRHPEDTREEIPLDEGFHGFGRVETDDEGLYRFSTIKPGRVPGADGRPQAPHLELSVFARGLLKRLVTRLYFADEDEANAEDPVLATVDPARRTTLMAEPGHDGSYRFDIRLQGEAETVFFDV